MRTEKNGGEMRASQAVLPDASGIGRRWRPAAAVRLSALVHVAGAVTLAAQPPWWPWVAGALAGNHLLLSAAVLWPCSSMLGPNLVRLPPSATARREVCLTFDDGPDPEVTPKVLDLLDRWQAKASFFCIGEKAAAYPHIVYEIARRGHSVENHSYCHSHVFAFYGLARLRREVGMAQQTLAGITGRTPRFFRAPAGFRSPLLDPVLAARGLRYVSWTRRGFDAAHDDPAVVLRRLVRGLVAGDVLLLHDGARTRTAHGESVALTVLPALLQRLAAENLRSVSLPMACREGF